MGSAGYKSLKLYSGPYLFADRELPLRPRELVLGIGNVCIWMYFGCISILSVFCRVSKRSLKVITCGYESLKS